MRHLNDTEQCILQRAREDSVIAADRLVAEYDQDLSMVLQACRSMWGEGWDREGTQIRETRMATMARILREAFDSEQNPPCQNPLGGRFRR